MSIFDDIATNKDLLNDPKEIFKAFGTQEIKEIIAGFKNLQTFEMSDGKVFPVASDVYAKKNSFNYGL